MSKMAEALRKKYGNPGGKGSVMDVLEKEGYRGLSKRKTGREDASETKALQRHTGPVSDYTEEIAEERKKQALKDAPQSERIPELKSKKEEVADEAEKKKKTKEFADELEKASKQKY